MKNRFPRIPLKIICARRTAVITILLLGLGFPSAIGSALGGDLTIRVGFCTTLTGANAGPASHGRVGIQAMVDWVNEGNVCLGKNQCLRIEAVDKGDDGSDPQMTRQLYEELARDPSIDFLIGPYGSDAATLVHPLAEASRKLILSPFSASDDLFSSRARWRVQVVPPASTFFDTLVGLLAQATVSDQPLPVALPAENDPFSRAANVFVRNHIEGHRETTFSVVFDSGRTPCAAVPGTDSPCYYPDAGGPAGALEDWMQDDLVPNTPVMLSAVAVLSAGHNTDGIRFAKELAALGLNPKVLAMTIAPASPTFFQAVGAYARGIIGNTAWHEPQEIFTAANTPNGFTFFGPTHAEASARIRALNGNIQPAYQAGSGGMAVLVLAKAIQAANGLKSYEKVRQEVHKLKLQTCFGQYQVDEATGYQTVGRMLMVQWHTPEDDPALINPALRVIAAPSNLPSVILSPFVYPKP